MLWNSCGFWELQPAVLGAIVDAPLSVEEAEVKESFRDNIITDPLWVGPSSSILCVWFLNQYVPSLEDDTKIDIENPKAGVYWVSSFFKSQKCLQLGPWPRLTKEDPEITVANRKNGVAVVRNRFSC